MSRYRDGSQRPPSRRHGTPGILRPVAEPTLVRMTGGGYFFLPRFRPRVSCRNRGERVAPATAAPVGRSLAFQPLHHPPHFRLLEEGAVVNTPVRGEGDDPVGGEGEEGGGRHAVGGDHEIVAG